MSKEQSVPYCTVPYWYHIPFYFSTFCTGTVVFLHTCVEKFHTLEYFNTYVRYRTLRSIIERVNNQRSLIQYNT